MRQSEVLSLMRENVAYKLQHGKAKEAVDMLEKLHKYATMKSFFFKIEDELVKGFPQNLTGKCSVRKLEVDQACHVPYSICHHVQC